MQAEASHPRDELLTVGQLISLFLLFVLHVVSIGLGVVCPAWLLEEVLHSPLPQLEKCSAALSAGCLARHAGSVIHDLR